MVDQARMFWRKRGAQVLLAALLALLAFAAAWGGFRTKIADLEKQADSREARLERVEKQVAGQQQVRSMLVEFKAAITTQMTTQYKDLKDDQNRLYQNQQRESERIDRILQQLAKGSR